MTGYTTYNKNKIRRFSAYRIGEHWIVLLIFGILIATGLSQKFYYLDISRRFILQIGGIDHVRLIHRYAGMAFSIFALMHIIVGIIGVTVKRWQPSMVINKKDFTDAIHDIKYYLGLESRPAACDRYTYKQKFEYWGILIGGLLMIISGVILWFPIYVTRFMPGEVIPAAKVLHSNQAFLMFLIIAIWHIYNSIFSPEVFPIDTVIFTGKISKERMMHEHPLEYERLFGGALEPHTGRNAGEDKTAT